MSQYDDLPAGAEVVGYSDLPPGAEVVKAPAAPRTAPPSQNLSGRPPLTSGLAAAAWGTKEALGGFGENIAGGLAGLGKAVFQPPQSEFEKYMLMIPGGLQMSRMARGMAPSADDIAQIPGAIKDIGESDDPAGHLLVQLPRALGQGAAALLTAGLLGKAGKGKPPLDSAGVARGLTDAVNPMAKDLAGYEQDLTKHFSKVNQYAKDNNLTINSRQSLTKAIEGAADTQRAHWYENILGPVKNDTVSITDIPDYSGISQGSNTTLGALDARLSAINAELNAKFAKGGIAGEAAVKSTGALNAERGAIRTKLYGELAKRTGLPAGDLAGVRGSFGALREMAEQTGLAASKARVKANLIEQGPITVNPFSDTKAFIVDKAINAFRGDPAAKAITKTINRAAVSPFSPPQPIFTGKTAVYRPEPIRTIPGSGDPVPSIFDRPEPNVTPGTPVRGPRVKPGLNRVPMWKKLLAESLSEEPK